MSRWQNNRGVRGKDVRDARPVCNGRRGHLERRGCDDGVAPFGRRRDRLELVVDERRHHLTLLLRRRRSLVGRSAPGMAHVGTNWRHVEAEADDPVTEVRRYAESHLRAERVELQPQRDERLNVTAQPIVDSKRASDTHPGSWVIRPVCKTSISLQAVSYSGTLQLDGKPGAGQPPIAHYGLRRDAALRPSPRR